MPLEPGIAEDILNLVGKYPDLTAVQKAILKSAAAFLVQDHLDGKFVDLPFEDFDPRLKMVFEEYEYVPNRIELLSGYTKAQRLGDAESPRCRGARKRGDRSDSE